MPYRIPAHIFDLDKATAERLTRLAIRRRNGRTAFAAALVAIVALAAFSAVL